MWNIQGTENFFLWAPSLWQRVVVFWVGTSFEREFFHRLQQIQAVFFYKIVAQIDTFYNSAS